MPLVGGSLYFLAGPLCMAGGGAILAAALYEIGSGLSPWVTPAPKSCPQCGKRIRLTIEITDVFFN